MSRICIDHSSTLVDITDIHIPHRSVRAPEDAAPRVVVLDAVPYTLKYLCL
jgi:hypothetical protein